jgi:CheY-like chemotaxis protein
MERSRMALKADTTSTRPTIGSRHPAGRLPDAAKPAPAAACHGQRILLVDDDPIVRDSLQEVLLAEGYAVMPAGDGQQALELVSRSQVDLVLLDLNMPVRNGWDTFEQLAREHPLLPVIIITARPYQVFTAASAGAGAMLEKPMEIPALLQVVQKLLAESPEERLTRLASKNREFQYQPAARKKD